MIEFYDGFQKELMVLVDGSMQRYIKQCAKLREKNDKKNMHLLYEDFEVLKQGFTDAMAKCLEKIEQHAKLAGLQHYSKWQPKQEEED